MGMNSELVEIKQLLRGIYPNLAGSVPHAEIPRGRPASVPPSLIHFHRNGAHHIPHADIHHEELSNPIAGQNFQPQFVTRISPYLSSSTHQLLFQMSGCTTQTLDSIPKGICIWGHMGDHHTMQRQ